jgi:hypothetical protein
VTTAQIIATATATVEAQGQDVLAVFPVTGQDERGAVVASCAVEGSHLGRVTELRLDGGALQIVEAFNAASGSDAVAEAVERAGWSAIVAEAEAARAEV